MSRAGRGGYVVQCWKEMRRSVSQSEKEEKDTGDERESLQVAFNGRSVGGWGLFSLIAHHIVNLISLSCDKQRGHLMCASHHERLFSWFILFLSTILIPAIPYQSSLKIPSKKQIP